MEWVETTGRTLDEAKDLALDRLGVDEDDAEFEVLEEPRPGLFGRLRGEARVRARVRPTQPRPKVDRRDRRRKPKGESRDAAPSTSPDVETTMPAGEQPVTDATDQPPESAGVPAAGKDEAGEAARAFLDGLVAAFGLTATVTVASSDDDLTIDVEGEDLGVLIGPRGQTLQAVQELTRLALHRTLGDWPGRVHVDVAGYRARRREALAGFAEQVARQVLASGTPRALEPMHPADRKVVHDTVNAIEGVTTLSEGEEPNRRVVIIPADA